MAPSAGESFSAVLDLFQTGVEMMRQNLLRAHPDARPDKIDDRLRQWLRDRPGAEAGDCPGPRVDLDARRP